MGYTGAATFNGTPGVPLLPTDFELYIAALCKRDKRLRTRFPPKNYTRVFHVHDEL